jgi:CubicO group peptidase (beta-lactamase class C family)
MQASLGQESVTGAADACHSSARPLHGTAPLKINPATRLARQRRRAPRWLGMLALVLLGSTAAQAQAQALPAATRTSLDQAVDTVMTRYTLPGIAVGVIEHGQVVYTRTAGERIAGSGQAIDARTLFKIASNSKAMTTALLGRLVDEGKLRWDDPVTKYLPQFQMHDPWVTANMRVADLLTHSSGLPLGGGDLMLWPQPNTFTADDIIHGLRYIAPAYSFRSRYEYDNLLYVVAGAVAAAAGGAPYATLMRREVFAPLGLDRCQVGSWNRDAVGDVAQPHYLKDGRNVPLGEDGAVIPALTSDPAGGIRCDLTDMLQWARNWLVPTHAQLQWLSPVQRDVLQAPHMLIPVSAQRRKQDDTHVMAYGYGWRMADVDGTWMVWHTGTLNGMYSMLALFPDQQGGFVFMINGSGDAARTVLGDVLTKHFTAPADTHDANWYADALDQASVARVTAAKAPTAAPAAVAASELAAWTGIYRDPWLGEVSICPQGDAVRFAAVKSPRLSGPVMRLDRRLLVHWDHPGVDPDAWLDFHAASGAEPITLRMAKVDPLGDFSSDYEDLRFQRIGTCPR